VQIVDTNIVAYLLLDGPAAPAARQLYALDPDWHSEPLLLHELTNVLATAVRTQGVSEAAAQNALALGRKVLQDSLHPVPDAEVLALACELSITGYDARFLWLAQVRGTHLVTEDARLRRAAPQLTQSLAEALAALA
jgi:predicted nucleic acid-binding protein